MKFTGATIILSAVYLASIVSAQIISVTSPLTGTKYKAGQEAIISWINSKVPTISQIVLAKGPSSALQPVLTIATNVNANDMKYVWKIPFELENGNEYAFEFGTSPDLAFAGPFTIEGAVGGTLSSSNATTSSGAPVVASSSSPAVAPPASGSVVTPEAPATTVTTTSSTSQHSASSSSTSAANKQAAGQAIVVLGLVAATVSQFF